MARITAMPGTAKHCTCRPSGQKTTRNSALGSSTTSTGPTSTAPRLGQPDATRSAGGCIHAPTESPGIWQTLHNPWDNFATLVILDDMCRIFDQFGWHFHYYSNRGEWVIRSDGSLTGNLVHRAFEVH